MERLRCDDGLSLSLSPPFPSTYLPSLPRISPAITERKGSLPKLTVGEGSRHDGGLSLSLSPPILSTHLLTLPLVSPAITERKSSLPKLTVEESSEQPARAVGPDMDTCVEFLMLVKKRLMPERYAAFLKVMKSFKEKRIDFNTLESELMEGLFKGQPKLILGISKFLGKGNKFTNSEREAAVHKFLDKLKERDKVLYALFLTMQDDYLNSTETVSVSEFCQKVARIFQGHDDLFKEYESFLYDDSEKDPFQYASLGRNLPGISLDERSLDMPMARRVYRGKVVVPSQDSKTEMRFGHEQRKQKSNGKEVDCDSNMEKQIKRMRVENHAECSKNKELNNSWCCAFKKISVRSNNDLVSKQLTKEFFVEGHLAREEMAEGTNNKRRSKRLSEDCKRGRKNMPDQLDKTAAKESGLSEASVLSSGEDQARATISESDLSYVLSRRCIEQLYGDHGEEMLKLLSKNAGKALPIVRRRLKQKLAEAKNHSLKLNEFLKDMKSKLKSERAV